MFRNWDESGVISQLYGDYSSQPMIWQNKDKWIIMWLSCRIRTKYCTNTCIWMKKWNHMLYCIGKIIKAYYVTQVSQQLNWTATSEYLLYIRHCLIHMGIVLNTDAVHPADVGRNTSEDGGPPVSVAARGRHKAGHTMDNPLAIDLTVQGATRVTLYSEKTHQTNLGATTPQLNTLFLHIWAQLVVTSPFCNTVTVACSSRPKINSQPWATLCRTWVCNALTLCAA